MNLVESISNYELAVKEGSIFIFSTFFSIFQLYQRKYIYYINFDSNLQKIH